jgi:hypothetical protein
LSPRSAAVCFLGLVYGMTGTLGCSLNSFIAIMGLWVSVFMPHFLIPSPPLLDRPVVVRLKVAVS